MDLKDLEKLKTIQWFTNLNIFYILQISEPIYPRLVKIFYNNLYIDEYDKSSTYIQGIIYISQMI